jgi:predicted nuclease of predicted toxin-antitoxin system
VIDAQLPPASSVAITEAGHFAEHVTDIGLLEADDRDIWRFALANDAVMITKDEDFVSISHRTVGEVTVFGCVWEMLHAALCFVGFFHFCRR